MKKILLIFIYMFQLSALTFGGGYVIVSFMRNIFVNKLNWITEEEMLDFTAIAQSSPGAIAVNASIIVGYKIAKFLGAVAAVLGTVLPPLIIITVVSYFYKEFASNIIVRFALNGMQAGIAAVITDVVISMATPYIKNKQIVSILILAATFILVAFIKINVMYIILACLTIGITFSIIKQIKGVKNDLS